MTAVATTPDLPTQPDPGPGPGVLPHITRLLGLLHKLIDYGKSVAGALRQNAADPRLALWARSFGTADVALILARITRGLLRAAALEARLSQCAARGQDIGDARKPAAPRACTTQPRTRPADPPARAIDHVPTAREIAAEIRRRPIGAVIVDICRDLGIVPGQMDRANWDELVNAIVAYGGSLSRYFKDVINRCLGGPIPGCPAIAPQARPKLDTPFPVAASTRPP